MALVMLWGAFGIKIALLCIASGFAIAVISGIIIGRLKAEKLLEPFVSETKLSVNANIAAMSWKERNACATNYTLDIIKKGWFYAVIGIGIGAWIRGYVPADFLARYAGSDKWYAVPLATMLGIPLYSNAAGIIPLASALAGKARPWARPLLS